MVAQVSALTALQDTTARSLFQAIVRAAMLVAQQKAPSLAQQAPTRLKAPTSAKSAHQDGTAALIHRRPRRAPSSKSPMHPQVATQSTNSVAQPQSALALPITSVHSERLWCAAPCSITQMSEMVTVSHVQAVLTARIGLLTTSLRVTFINTLALLQSLVPL